MAGSLDADYFLCLDDDFLAYPPQLGALFRQLLKDPTVPHGIAGKIDRKYIIRKEAEVEDLYTAYAVTRECVATYRIYLDELATKYDVPKETVEFWADDIVISRSGSGRAKVHDVGYLHLCPTASSANVAVFQQEGFRQIRAEVLQAVEELRADRTGTSKGTNQ